MTNKEELQIFCKNLKYLRKKYKLSQKEMAKICGVGVLSIRKLENGIIPKHLGAGIFINISKVLRMSPSVLLTYLIECEENLSKKT